MYGRLATFEMLNFIRTKCSNYSRCKMVIKIWCRACMLVSGEINTAMFSIDNPMSKVRFWFDALCPVMNVFCSLTAHVIWHCLDPSNYMSGSYGSWDEAPTSPGLPLALRGGSAMQMPQKVWDVLDEYGTVNICCGFKAFYSTDFLRVSDSFITNSKVRNGGEFRVPTMFQRRTIRAIYLLRRAVTRWLTTIWFARTSSTLTV